MKSSRVAFGACLAAMTVALAPLHGVAALANSESPAGEITHLDIAIAKASPVLTAYQKTPTHAKRQAAYGNTWTNPQKILRYDDNHTLTIRMVKNPSDLNGTTHIKKEKHTIKKSADPAHSGWVCSTQSIKLSADSTSFLNNDYSNANSHIYPGAIFTFEDFYGGQYKEQEGARNPMMLYTDNPNINGSSGVNVKDPSIVTCHDAIATLYRRMTGPAANEESDYQAYESFNSADLNMQISGGASGYGVSFNDAFGSNSSSRSVAITVDARKAVYSITALPPDNGFFVDKSVESTPNLMVVSNVVYGVRVLANLTVTFSSTQEANDFKAAYSGYGISANGAFDYLSKHSSTSSAINGYVVGGAVNTSNVTFDPKSFLSGINKVLNSVTYENARPISYQFMDMADDIVGAQSATDTFTTVTCAPASDNPKVENVQVVFKSGSDGKDWDTNLNVYLYPPRYMNNPANDDKVGAIYGYQSRGHSTAFGGTQTNFVYLTPGDGAAVGPTLTRNDFIKYNGGHVRMHIYPNGHDTWNIQQMDIIFDFDDGTTADYSFPPFTVSQDVTTYDVTFDASKFAP